MRFRNNYLALMAAVILLVGCGRHVRTRPVLRRTDRPGKARPEYVDVTEAKRLIAARQVTVLDVRTPDEFNAGHIAGAKNLNFSDGDFQAEVQQLEKGQPYLVQCRTGRRSAQAGAVMKQLGFKSVYDLAGGIKAWEEAKEEVVK